jgi:site-specific recombinase XerD
VTSNPARLVRHRHEENGGIRWLTDEEEARLRAVITEHFPERLSELAISLGTGMRLTEQYKMCWNAVDFERREVGLSGTKNHGGRSIPMTVEFLEAFAGLKARNPVAKNRSSSDEW